ncbi:MAG: phytanoyl-CoA dioxygenase, partial [Pseudomonadota bacterium]
GDADPQANLHSDTFHPTAKFWLFLHDVSGDDGPFSYAPGSHILTPERLAWEHEQALVAAGQGDRHHAAGSFRLPEADLPTLGYGTVQTFPVKANTLVVADTYGFHRRTPSRRPTIRTSLYGVLRRNPFIPWNGLDGYDLPVLRTRVMAIHIAMQDRRARANKPVVYANMGRILAHDDARE